MPYSSGDLLALVAELNVNRISKVCGKRTQRLGGMILVNDKERVLLNTARRLDARYRRGDYRHTDQERGRIEQLCSLLLLWHSENEHCPQRHVKFDSAQLDAKRACAAGMYERMLQRAAQGWEGLQKPPERSGLVLP